jgi:hypothetical protein
VCLTADCAPLSSIVSAGDHMLDKATDQLVNFLSDESQSKHSALHSIKCASRSTRQPTPAFVIHPKAPWRVMCASPISPATCAVCGSELTEVKWKLKSQTLYCWPHYVHSLCHRWGLLQSALVLYIFVSLPYRLAFLEGDRCVDSATVNCTQLDEQWLQQEQLRLNSAIRQNYTAGQVGAGVDMSRIASPQNRHLYGDDSFISTGPTADRVMYDT